MSAVQVVREYRFETFEPACTGHVGAWEYYDSIFATSERDARKRFARLKASQDRSNRKWRLASVRDYALANVVHT